MCCHIYCCVLQEEKPVPFVPNTCLESVKTSLQLCPWADEGRVGKVEVQPVADCHEGNLQSQWYH